VPGTTADARGRDITQAALPPVYADRLFTARVLRAPSATSADRGRRPRPDENLRHGLGGEFTEVEHMEIQQDGRVVWAGPTPFECMLASLC
jgi:hypothetical protein